MIRPILILAALATPMSSPSALSPENGARSAAQGSAWSSRLRAEPPSATGGRAGRVDVSQSAARISASEAATIVRDSTGGRVLGVKRESLAGRAVYRVKLLTTAGRVRMLRVDASNGRIIR